LPLIVGFAIPALSTGGDGHINWTLILLVVGGVVAGMQPQYSLPNVNPTAANPTMAPPYGQAPPGNSALKTGLATGLGVATGRNRSAISG
jgi:hypothetical protein